MRYFLCFIFFLSYTGAVCATELRATVNDKPISDLDVENWAQLLQFQQPQKYNTMSQQELNAVALESAIESEVKKQTATAQGIKVSSEDLLQARTHLETQNVLASHTLSAVLAKNHVPEAILNKQIESDLLWLKYLHTQSAQLAVSDLAVNKRYQAMKNELKKQGIEGDSIMLWEMAQGIFSEDVDVSTTLESKTCDAFLEHIKIGPFPDSAQRGWTDPTQLPPELVELLKEKAVGETLGPLRTPNGILVMMKCDVRSQQVMPSKEQLKMQMEVEQMDVLSRRLLSEASRRAVIERKE